MGADAILSYDVFARDRGATHVFRKVADSADGVQKSFKKTKDGASSLADQFEKTKARVAELRTEFARTGEFALLKEIRKGERDLSNLSGWAKHFPRDVQPASGALSKFKTAVMGLGDATARVAGSASAFANPWVIGSAAAVGAMAALPIAAVATGAALAGVGAGFIGIGIMAAKSSKAVQGEFQTLKSQAQAQFSAAGRAMEQPLLRAMGTVRTSLRDLGPSLAGMVDSVAPSTEKLAQGLDGLSRNALPGLKTAVAESATVMDALAAEMPALGSAVGSFFDSIGDGSEGGVKALNATMRLTEGGIIVLGEALEHGSKAFNFFAEHSMPGVKALFQTRDAAQAATTGMHAVTASNQQAKAAIEATEMANLDLATSMKNVSNMAVALAGSEIAAIDSRHRMVEELKNGTRTLDVNTDAGRRNKESILNGVAAAIRYGEAETKRTGNANAGAAAQQRHTDAMYNNAVSVLKNKGAVDALWRALGLLPPTKAVPVSAPGAAPAADQVRRLRDAVNNLPSFKRLSIVTEYRTIGRAADVNVAKRQGEAAGGSTGGLVGRLGPKRNGYRAGGLVAGGGTTTSDSVGIWASRREFVTQASAVSKIGVDNMEFMNRTGQIPAGGGRGVERILQPIQLILDNRVIIEAVQRYENSNGSGWRQVP